MVLGVAGHKTAPKVSAPGVVSTPMSTSGLCGISNTVFTKRSSVEVSVMNSGKERDTRVDRRRQGRADALRAAMPGTFT